MKLRLHSIYIPYTADQEKALADAVRKRLGEHHRTLASMTIARRSIDARQRPVRFVYSVDVSIHSDAAVAIKDAVIPPSLPALTVTPGTRPLTERPVVVGAGPAGLFAALLLAEHGYRPRLIERGGTVDERIDALKSFSKSRIPDPENNALFGLGGAGTFSDGKLRTGVNHSWLPAVMQVLAECGAPKDILVDAKPHIGTDILTTVVTRLVRRIEVGGGSVHTGVRLDGLVLKNGALTGVDTTMGRLACRTAILAIGHSARDTWEMLQRAGVDLAPKAFQIGIRVEHPQAWVDENRYGRAAGDPRLGAADYKLAAKAAGVPVFSFCMCPGGETMPTISEPERLTVNGMSLSGRASPFASSGLVVTLTPETYGGNTLTEALAFQRDIEAACFRAGGSDYTAPGQRLVDFVTGVPSRTLPAASYRLGVIPAPLHDLLPSAMVVPLRGALSQFHQKLKGYLHSDALALAPESRASSPIRILRDKESLQSTSVSGLYPVGEGAGYAGGITSAALDGLDAARKVIETFAPL